MRRAADADAACCDLIRHRTLNEWMTDGLNAKGNAALALTTSEHLAMHSSAQHAMQCMQLSRTSMTMTC